MKFEDREAKQKGGRARSSAKAEAVRLNAQRARAKELAGEYPILGRPYWSPPDVVTIGRLLKRLPQAERAQAVALIGQDGVPPYKAVAILEKLPSKTPEDRAAIYRLASSVDAQERDLALTRALDLPPPLDPATPHVQRARDELRAAVRYTRLAHLRSRWEEALEIVATTLKELMPRTGG